MRVALIDFDDVDLWPRAPNRFASLEDRLKLIGHETRLVTVARRAPGPTIVSGAERERDIESLVLSARALAALSEPIDLVICPLRGGIAHAILMARACGELPYSLKVALWCDGASRARLLDGDCAAQDALGLVVADAMERICLEHADHILFAQQDLIDALASLGVSMPPATLVDPWRAAPQPRPAQHRPLRLAYIGALAQRCGLFAFVEAVERLRKEERIAIGEIAFVTRRGDPATSAGARWLELRMRRWDFPHRIHEIRSDAEAAQFVAEEGRLSLVCAYDETELPDWLAASGGVGVVNLGGGSLTWSARIEAALVELVAGHRAPARADAADWSQALARISAPEPLQALPPLPSVSVCMLHFDRSRLLEAALASFTDEGKGEGVDTIIVDNASRQPESHALIDRLEKEGVARIIRIDRSQPLPEAYNHAIRAATGDYVVFLDDDNMFTPQGLTRLRRACAASAFDVVVSNLDMFDADGETLLDGPRLAFIGQARSAGLFFNAFGDTCMAFRRDALQRLGGYFELGAPYPSPDWLLLARAQAAGLRIGVLQNPAYRYRRRPLDAAPVWQKFDRHSPRRLVMNHYGDVYDGAIVARLAQIVELEL